METYNHTPHRGLGREQTPGQVHDWRELSLIKNEFKRMFKKSSRGKKRVNIDLTVDDRLRLQTISRTHYQFSKAYRVQIPIYYLEDLEGEEVKC